MVHLIQNKCDIVELHVILSMQKWYLIRIKSVFSLASY